MPDTRSHIDRNIRSEYNNLNLYEPSEAEIVFVFGNSLYYTCTQILSS